MFTIITPDLRGRYGALVSKIIATREGYEEPGELCFGDAHDTPSTIYIAYENPQRKSFGSARVNGPQDSLAELFYKTFFPGPLINKAREVDLVSFSMEDSLEDPLDLFVEERDLFYKGLLQVLKDLAKREDFKALFSCSLSGDHEDLILFGGWTFKDTRSFQIKGQHLTVGEIKKTG